VSGEIVVALIGGISTVLVGVLTYLGHKISKGFDLVNGRIDRVEAKVDRVEEKIDGLSEAVGGRIDSLVESQANARERLAPIETLSGAPTGRPAEGRP
jgi:hypothetical protein